MVTSTGRHLVYERDEHGSPYAVEVVEAERWNETLRRTPDPEVADARVVRLRSGEVPADLPRWLQVEHVEAAAARVAERPADYSTTPGEALGAGLWPWSPSYRGPGASLGEFLAAGAVALSHPEPAPAEARRRLEALARFAAGRPPPLRAVATLREEALERWLRYAFGEPERFADHVLLERIAADPSGAAAPEVVAALRFLHAAEVPASAAEHAELAIDRRVLLEQASPWRYLESAPFAGALAAIRSWRIRYRFAYDAHYRGVLVRARELRRGLAAAAPAAAALQRFDAIEALGLPLGEPALAAYEEAVAAVAALPPDPDQAAARTAGVTLGSEPPLFEEARAAIEAVRGALEAQRLRLASEAVSAVLSRPGVPALDRLLQAIGASDLDGLERALSDELAAHIDGLLRDAGESPLAAVAARAPRVTADTLDEAVAAFREVLEEALAASTDGTVVLREDRP